jgi:hypothetical protein
VNFYPKSPEEAWVLPAELNAGSRFIGDCLIMTLIQAQALPLFLKVKRGKTSLSMLK